MGGYLLCPLFPLLVRGDSLSVAVSSKLLKVSRSEHEQEKEKERNLISRHRIMLSKTTIYNPF